MRSRLSYLLTCHNDVIDAGKTNRLIASGTYMDRALLRLSHMQKDTYYVQICDELSYMYLCKHSDVQHDLHII